MLARLFVTVLLSVSGGMAMDEFEMATAWEEGDDEPQEERTTSGSEVVDAGAILRLRIDDASLGPWTQPPGEQLETRQAKLRLKLIETLKGRVDQAAGESFEIAVTQRGGLVVLTDPGPWSEVKTTPGTELLAFVHGASTDARMLLGEEHIIRLAEATKGLLDDLTAALALEQRNAAPDAILNAATGFAGRLGDLFARYAWYRLRDSVLASIPLLDSYLRLLENPKTRIEARSAYLNGLYDHLGMMSTPPRDAEVKLAQSMCRLLLLPQAETLWPQIAGVFLPNLVRADAVKPKYTPAEIVDAAGLKRAPISQAAAAVAGQEERARRLEGWLAR